MPALAIVIPAYRSERTIGGCLARFLTEVPDAEIVVVDSSPDGRSAAIAERFPSVRTVRSPERLLPHAARNLGVRTTDAPLLLFTDPDIYPRAGAITTLLELHGDLGGGIVAAIASYRRSYVDLAAHTAKFDLWLPRRGSPRVQLGPTAGLLVSRADWRRVGGIPETGMLGDTRFSWALEAAGVPLHLAGGAVFDHDHGASMTGLVRERFARGREFATLRRERSPGVRHRVRDVTTTITLLRPARVALRSISSSWRHDRRAAAVATAPLVAVAQLAWFAGELVGLARGGR